MSFQELVWKAVTVVGRSAPAVVDAIMRAAFPATTRAAEQEEALHIWRTGLIDETKRILKKAAGDKRQTDFSQISAEFQRIVRRLGNEAYYVEALGEYCPVTDLITQPEWLDDARRFMRRKGMECLAEANTLDELYEAVVAAETVPA